MTEMEINKSDFYTEKEMPVPLINEEVRLECGNRIDLLAGHSVVVEIKSADAINDVHIAQELTCLKLANCQIGLLVNFYIVFLSKGIKRVITNISDLLADHSHLTQLSVVK